MHICVGKVYASDVIKGKMDIYSFRQSGTPKVTMSVLIPSNEVSEIKANSNQPVNDPALAESVSNFLVDHFSYDDFLDAEKGWFISHAPLKYLKDIKGKLLKNKFTLMLNTSGRRDSYNDIGNAILFRESLENATSDDAKAGVLYSLVSKAHLEESEKSLAQSSITNSTHSVITKLLSDPKYRKWNTIMLIRDKKTLRLISKIPGILDDILIEDALRIQNALPKSERASFANMFLNSFDPSKEIMDSYTIAKFLTEADEQVAIKNAHKASGVRCDDVIHQMGMSNNVKKAVILSSLEHYKNNPPKEEYMMRVFDHLVDPALYYSSSKTQTFEDLCGICRRIPDKEF